MSKKIKANRNQRTVYTNLPAPQIPHARLTICVCALLVLLILLSVGASSALSLGVVILFSAVTTILSSREPYLAGLCYVAIFILLSSHASLRNPLSALGAILVTGAWAYRVPRPHALLLATIMWYLGSVEILSAPFSPILNIGSVILGLLFAGSLATGELWKKRDRQYAQDRKASEELVHLHQEATITALHDSVAGLLTSAIFRAESMNLAADLPSHHKETAQLICDDLRQGITEVRSLIKTITNEGTFLRQEEGLTLEEHLLKFKDRLESYGFVVKMDIAENSPLLSYSLEGNQQLIVPELTSNILKYGEPKSTIYLSLKDFCSATQILVTNEVAQAQNTTQMSTGLGLREIRQEVERLDGTCQFQLVNNTWHTTLIFPR